MGRFSKIISAQFFGHTHSDNFVVYRNSGKVENVAFVTPSLTTFEYRMPTFRIFEVNKSNGRVVNYE